MAIFIFIFIILFALLAWRRLELATALAVAALPAYQIRFNLGFLPMTLLEAMILVLFAVWFIKSWRAGELPLFSRQSRGVQNYPFYLEIILLLIIAFVSAAVAGFTNASLGILKAYFIEPIMFFIVFVNIFSARGGPAWGWQIKENKENIFWALAISAFVVSAVAIYQWLTGNLLPLAWQGSGRVTGVFSYPNALGLYLGPIIPVLVGFLLSLRAKRSNPINFSTSYFYGIAASSIMLLLAMTGLAIYFSHSQGALIGLIIAAVVFGILYNLRSRVMVMVIAVIALITLSLSPALLGRLQSKILLRDLDGQIRRQQWTETKKMLLDGRVIFGAGLANYQRAVAPYHQEGIFVWDYDDPDFLQKIRASAEFRAAHWQPLEIYLYPHNIFLNFWTELGLAGMLLFIWVIVKYFYIGITLLLKLKKNVTSYWLLVTGLLCAMIVIIVHGLVDAPYFKNDLAVLFWVIVGMLGVYHLDARPQINKSFTNNTNKSDYASRCS